MNKKIHILALFFLLVFSGLTLEGNAQKFSKHEIKSAFIYNIIRFVSWQPDKQIITVGVVGENEFTPVLKSKLANNKIDSRNIKIVQINDDQENKAISNCDVLYIAEKDSTINTSELIESVSQLNILTISEIDDFCNKGGIVQFIENNNATYHFIINQNQALKKRIQISSKLLKLAIKVL